MELFPLAPRATAGIPDRSTSTARRHPLRAETAAPTVDDISSATRGRPRRNASRTVPVQWQRQRAIRQTLAWLSTTGLQLDDTQTVQDIAATIARWKACLILLQADDPRPTLRLPAHIPCIGIEYLNGSFGVVYQHDLPTHERDALILSILAQFAVDALLGSAPSAMCLDQHDPAFKRLVEPKPAGIMPTGSPCLATITAMRAQDDINRCLTPPTAAVTAHSHHPLQQHAGQDHPSSLTLFVSLFLSQLATAGQVWAK